jgi:peptide/nickel transport system permease protein
MAARVGQAVVVLLFVSLFVFILLRVAGDPGASLLPIDATPQQRAALRESFGLTQPWPVQYFYFVRNLFQGDFGISFVSHQPAMGLVLERLPATLELTFLAMGISLALGLPLGILTAVRRGVVDTTVTNLSLLAQALPAFWVGEMLILLFAVTLGWLPTSGRGSPSHVVLPAASLSLFLFPQILILVRAGMQETLLEPYIETARAKGLPKRIILFRHALRNVLVPVITMVGLNFGALLGGAVITESVFAWPGVGLLGLQSINSGDFPVVQSAVFVLAVSVIVTNLIVDLLYGVIDPRIRVG